MPSINDWAAKAARHIHMSSGVTQSEERLAAVIITFAKPLLALLEPRRHYHCEDGWYCCGKCTCGCGRDHDHDEDCYPSSHDGEAAREYGVCNCGADAFNAQLATALSGKP